MTDILKQIDKQWEAFYKDTGRPPKYIFVGCLEMEMLDRALGMVALEYRGMMVVVCEVREMLVVADKVAEG